MLQDSIDIQQHTFKLQNTICICTFWCFSGRIFWFCWSSLWGTRVCNFLLFGGTAHTCFQFQHFMGDCAHVCVCVCNFIIFRVIAHMCLQFQHFVGDCAHVCSISAFSIRGRISTPPPPLTPLQFHHFWGDCAHVCSTSAFYGGLRTRVQFHHLWGACAHVCVCVQFQHFAGDCAHACSISAFREGFRPPPPLPPRLLLSFTKPKLHIHPLPLSNKKLRPTCIVVLVTTYLLFHCLYCSLLFSKYLVTFI